MTGEGRAYSLNSSCYLEFLATSGCGNSATAAVPTRAREWFRPLRDQSRLSCATLRLYIERLRTICQMQRRQQSHILRAHMFLFGVIENQIGKPHAEGNESQQRESNR